MQDQTKTFAVSFVTSFYFAILEQQACQELCCFACHFFSANASILIYL